MFIRAGSFDRREDHMYEMISYCGLDCSACPAYLATQKDDMAELAEVAKEWSKQFKMEIPPESIVCDGCKTSEDTRRSGYCSTCGVRACAVERGVATCAHCEEYACETLRGCPAYLAEGRAALDKIREGLTTSGPRDKTMDLVVHHELKGVTPEMIDWWWDNIDTTERYRMWHPESHQSFAWESIEGDEHIGRIHRVTELIAGNPITLRIRWEDPDSIPIERIYSHANAASILDDKDEPISRAIHEYEAAKWGTKMRSTFMLPATAPDSFIEGLRKHNEEEMAQFPVFLPALYEKAGNE
jgi:hypothetical protein